MAALRVVMVEPRHEGNVGAVARVMKNFGVKDLRLVRPCPLGVEARRRAMHGADVLATARTTEDLESAIADADFVVATSGVATVGEKKFHRLATTPRELATKVAGYPGRVALVLGREDFGLFNEELQTCDALVTIPTAPDYPILNVAVAAAILLHEVHAVGAPWPGPRASSAAEKAKLLEAFDELLTETRYPEHKRERTTVMFRRLLGRAAPSKWEFHALMGVLARASKTIRRERTRTGGKRGG